MQQISSKYFDVNSVFPVKKSKKQNSNDLAAETTHNFLKYSKY